MGASVGGNNRFVSEINVTPFVDVMLVLLIIFMVATPMMSQGLEVDLPQTKQVEVLPTENDNMMLTVRHDGKIFLDEYEVQTMDDLEGYLQTLSRKRTRPFSCVPTRKSPTAWWWMSGAASRPWASKSSAWWPIPPRACRPLPPRQPPKAGSSQR